MWLLPIILICSSALRTAVGATYVKGGLSGYISNESSDFGLLQEVGLARHRKQQLRILLSEMQLQSQACNDNLEGFFSTERQLAQENTSMTALNSSASSHIDDGDHDDHGHHAHQHDALVYMVVVLLVGTAVLHLTMYPAFRKLPFTVVLFVLGMISSSFMQKDDGSLGKLGDSYSMWMGIDPELLIFIMLPPLLTGDAMSLDTSVAKRVFNQWLWLAGPGVLFGSFAVASFLWVYLQWPFLLCLCLGAILCETDHMAVVGLLKDIGAAPTLTVQIQGESLLNDGTAMVLFNVTYSMLAGEQYDIKSVLLLLLYLIGCSWFLGMVIGGVFSAWIKSACNRLEHHSNMVQIMCTICCAYGSFVFAEGVIGLNGLLSTVATSFVLADTIWPKIVSPESMHEVWHTFEYIGYTIVFFVAGAIGGRSLFLIGYMDVVHLMILYVVLMVVRAIIIFGSRPVMRLLSPDRTPVTAADAALMTWGGLRGAVGLALALQVMRDKAGNNIDEVLANRVFFFTAGISFLTLVINATTCPSMVETFGLVSTSTCKTKVMLELVERLKEKTEGVEGQVKKNMDNILFEVQQHLTRGLTVEEFSEWAGYFKKRQAYDDGHGHTHFSTIGLGHCKKSAEIVANFELAKERFSNVPEFDKRLLGWDDGNPLLTQERKIISLALEEPDPRLTRTVTEAFLQLVRAQVWSQIRRSQFVEGTRAIDVLLSSNTKAFKDASDGLTDYESVQSALGIYVDTSGEQHILGEEETDADGTNLTNLGVAVDREVTFAKRVVENICFEGTILFLIMCNAVVMFFDPGPDAENSMTFALIECFFMVFYLIELVLKLQDLGRKYIADGWNALDFMCIVLGSFGIVTTFFVEYGVLDSNAISSEMMLIRLGRVFKFLRVMRVVGFIKHVAKARAQYAKKKICPMLANHLDLIFTLRGFVQAHVRAHGEFLRFFGAQRQRCKCGNKLMADSNFCRKCGTERPPHLPKGEFAVIGTCEHARCILESWTEIFNAALVCSHEIQLVDSEGAWILEGLSALRETTDQTNDLTNFVIEAADCGVLLPKNAEAIIHPIHHQIRHTEEAVAEIHAGIIGTAVKRHSVGARVSTKATGSTVPNNSSSVGSTPESEECASEPSFRSEDDKTKDMVQAGVDAGIATDNVVDEWDDERLDI